eukprot:TRINITY_DN4266_c0_g1_i1.p1 TRINITY_DN4266_c0_g1~~TRINITY_DN4266_c0_g1_i1.p1  ORF type:complete len:1061 (-),score=192.13 TRINITY_DN4266_c0_g1_i1:47-3229(-)
MKSKGGKKGRGKKDHDDDGGGKGGGHGGKRNTYSWINSQIIQASQEADPIMRVLGVVEVCISDMNLVNLSTAIHRLAKLSSSTPNAANMLGQVPIMKSLLAGIAKAFAQVGQDPSLPQSLSNITWSLATLRIMDYQVLEQAGSLAVLNMQDFKAFELASLLWSFAKLGTAESMTPVVGPLFRSATNRLIACVSGAGCRSLATAAWAFATAKQASQRLFRSISKEIQTCLPSANSQELANITWAYGTVGHRDDQLFTLIAQEAIVRLDGFKMQELSNTLWGFASNDFYHEAFFTRALYLARGMQLQPQHVANILWAAARLQRNHPVARSTVIDLIPGCLSSLTSFKPQEVASTAHAIAKIFASGEAGASADLQQKELPLQIVMFFSAISPWCERQISRFSDQSLANIVASFGTLNLRMNDSFVVAIESQAMRRAENLDNGALITLLRSSIQSPQLGSLQAGLAARISQIIGHFSGKELRSLAYTKSIKLGVVHKDAEPNKEELLRWCMELAEMTQQPPPFDAFSFSSDFQTNTMRQGPVNDGYIQEAPVPPEPTGVPWYPPNPNQNRDAGYLLLQQQQLQMQIDQRQEQLDRLRREAALQGCPGADFTPPGAPGYSPMEAPRPGPGSMPFCAAGMPPPAPPMMPPPPQMCPMQPPNWSQGHAEQQVYQRPQAPNMHSSFSNDDPTFLGLNAMNPSPPYMREPDFQRPNFQQDLQFQADSEGRPDHFQQPNQQQNNPWPKARPRAETEQRSGGIQLWKEPQQVRKAANEGKNGPRPKPRQKRPQQHQQHDLHSGDTSLWDSQRPPAEKFRPGPLQPGPNEPSMPDDGQDQASRHDSTSSMHIPQQDTSKHFGREEDDDDFFNFQWPDEVPRSGLNAGETAAAGAVSTDSNFPGSPTRTADGADLNIFRELNQDLKNSASLGFSTPTQSADLSFLTELQQRLKLDRLRNDRSRQASMQEAEHTQTGLQTLHEAGASSEGSLSLDCAKDGTHSWNSLSQDVLEELRECVAAQGGDPPGLESPMSSRALELLRRSDGALGIATASADTMAFYRDYVRQGAQRQEE